jgi:hypothetical protein
MKYTTFVSTLAALCVSVALSSSAYAQAQAQAPAPAAEPPRNLKGIYGGASFGVGMLEDPDSTDYAWRLHTWYRPFEYGAIELGYAKVDGDDGADVDGLHLVLVPTFPIRSVNLDLFGKIGGFFHSSDDDLSLGLGAAYHLPKGLGLRFDYDRLNVGRNDSADIVTLGVFYHLDQQGK